MVDVLLNIDGEEEYTIKKSFSHDIFLWARKFYKDSSNRDVQIAVLNEMEVPMFFLEYSINKNYAVWSTGMIVDPLWEYDLFTEISNIDTFLFDGKEVVMFWQVEEYTYAITEFLIKYFPNIKILYRDKNARLFWNEEQVTIIESTYEAEVYVRNKSAIYIYSHGYHATGIIPNIFVALYDSMSVMKSLLWRSKVNTYGELNPDKKILLIDCPTYGPGLVDIVKFTMTYVKMAEISGMIPVVDYSKGERQYRAKDDNANIWEKFFVPVSDIKVDEVYESEYVVRLTENNDSLNEVMNPLFCHCFALINLESLKTNSIFKKRLGLNTVSRRYVEEKLPIPFQTQETKILGVIMRGTDYRNYALEKRGEKIRNTDIKVVINRMKELIEQNKFSHVFVATEESGYLEMFKKVLGDKIIFINQERIDYVEERDKDCWVSDLLNVNDEKLAMDYLTVLIGLSMCDGLISSMGCGAYLAARYFRGSKYMVDEIVK